LEGGTVNGGTKVESTLVPSFALNYDLFGIYSIS
jgi:hypothetical protein